VACKGCVVPRANDGFAGVTVIETSVATTPVPLRLTVGLTLALSAMVNVAARVPVVAGVKNTETTQLDPAARLLGRCGQVEVVV
jgi:hypothetical protein